MDKFSFDAIREYKQLDDLIKETSTQFERLVSGQGAAAPLQYVRWTLYLCLIRQINKDGECYSVRWAKYRVSESGRKTWYKDWTPGKVSILVKQWLGSADYKTMDLD